MRQFSESELEELSLRFRGIYEIDEKVEELKETMKTFNASRKEAFKALSETMEIGVNSLKKGYKDYIASIEDPQSLSESDAIVVMLKEFNLLKKEKAE